MKNSLQYLFLGIFLTLSTIATATNPYVSFAQPYNGQRIQAGSDLYVRVNAGSPYGIAYVNLYVNNHFVATEHTAPYEWGKPHAYNQHILNNLLPGTYHLRAEAFDHYGYKIVKTITIHVEFNNKPPVVHFVTPIHGQHFPEGTDLYVKVNATDYDGHVDYVKLYVNGHFVGTEQTAPYEWGKPHAYNQHRLNNLAHGTYTLRAEAYDNYGLKGSKTITIYVDRYNKAPVVHFQKPYHGQHFPYGSNIGVEVTATDYDDYVAYVELFINGQLVGRETHAPYQWGKPYYPNQHLLNNLPQGTYHLKAVAYDNYGKKGEKVITIYVDAKVNYAPVVDFIKPYNGQHFPYGSDIGVEVSATDYDDYVAYVELFINGHLVGRETHAPYQWGKPYYHNQHLLNDLSNGTYHLKAVAYDNYGKKGEKVITIYVDEPVYEACPDLLKADFAHYPLGNIAAHKDWYFLGNTSSGKIVWKDGKKVLKLSKTHGLQSALLNLGGLHTGTYEFEWYAYVPLYNKIECKLYSTSNHEGNIYEMASMPFENTQYQPQWTKINLVVDLDNDYIRLLVDGIEVYDQYMSDYSLGYLSFQTAAHAYSEYYIDGIRMFDPYCDVYCKDIVNVSFEGYQANSKVTLNDKWYKLSNTTSATIAQSATNHYLAVDNTYGEQSALLDLGHLNTGKYAVNWQVYVADHSYAACNFYSSSAANNKINKLAGIEYTSAGYANQWVNVESIVDLDYNKIIVKVNGQIVLDQVVADYKLGFMAFETIAGKHCKFYIDDIVVKPYDCYTGGYAGTSNTYSFKATSKPEGMELFTAAQPLTPQNQDLSLATFKGANATALQMNTNDDAISPSFDLTNSPNPFTDQTQISFNLPEAMDLTIGIFNTSGQEVRRLDGNYYAGLNQIDFMANDLTAGIYIIKVQGKDINATHKMIIK